MPETEQNESEVELDKAGDAESDQISDETTTIATDDNVIEKQGDDRGTSIGNNTQEKGPDPENLSTGIVLQEDSSVSKEQGNCEKNAETEVVQSSDEERNSMLEQQTVEIGAEIGKNIGDGSDPVDGQETGSDVGTDSQRNVNAAQEVIMRLDEAQKLVSHLE
eukprot:CAMPEP_0115025912 /NCGR_PEP_ID=MMETSP0216-20121206/34362_1 /TAXON_ID=223996 /ORGANISM="Protocruzia adherens, Strain Boccale" /LENGTH=162 /DNA_ID=CAMNT_0002400745 /DNA_START=245 /DNA_END=733 /DNA_ORIENTATION=+